MTVAPESDLESRWDAALVARVVRIRMLAAVALGVMCALLPVLGDDRFSIALLLVGPIPAVGLFVHRHVEPDRMLAVATVVDLGWSIVVVLLMPILYAPAMVVAMAMLAFVAHEGRRHLTISAVLGVVGFTVAGVVRDVDMWIVMVVTFVVLLPLIFFVSLIQREREVLYNERIRYRAEHDSLTGLWNREGLAAAISGLTIDGVLAIDLDGFKDINDTLGHKAGDELLVALSLRMADIVGDTGVLARTGGDEFSVLVHDGDPSRMARDLLRSCRHRFTLGDIDVSIGASIGVAFAEPDVDAVELIRRADLAMYEAKRSQVGVRRWNDRTRSASRQRVSLSGDVERGFETNEFELFFQPIVETQSGRLVDVEGLLRWRHPRQGILTPADFLELVEGIGHRATMDRVVFDQAAALAARLQPLNVGVSVNVSAGSILRSSVPRVLDETLRRHDVVPQRITVEVIEDEMIDERSTARAVLNALGDLGVGIAIDDFGTGHSSLSRLRHLPVTSLKIDRCFVSGMRDSEDDQAIVRAVSHLGRSLDLIVVAEGVEDQGVLDHIRTAGLPIDRLQGFRIAEPMPAAVLDAWIERHQTIRV